MLRPLLGLIKRLMPREEPFIDHFVDHARCVAEAAAAFRAIVHGEGSFEQNVATIRRMEREADAITEATVEATHRSFITPFDRSQIQALIDGLDDCVDTMKDAARRMMLRGIRDFTPEMKEMADHVVRCAEMVRDSMPLLGSISKESERLLDSFKAVKRAKKAVNELRDSGLATLWASEGVMSPGEKLLVEETYDLVASVADRLKDVAKTVTGIVTEHV
jgi:predicted phosphate transport protein (TIGR00153 family)